MSQQLEKVRILTDNLIELEFSKRKKSIDDKIQVALSRLSAQGAGSSSAALNAVQDLCKKELGERSDFIIDSYKQVLSNTNIKLGEEMKSKLKNDSLVKLTPSLGELNQYIDKYSKAMKAKMPNLDIHYQQEIQKMSNEFDLYFEERRKNAHESMWYRNRPIQAAIIGGLALIVTTLMIIFLG